MTHGDDKEVTFRSGRTKADAALIQPFERDKKLDLHSTQWGSQLDPCWRPKGREERRHFRRRVRIRVGNRKSTLDEYMVRFPSAPIYGINRKQDYETNFKSDRPNMHTLRLLCRSDMGNEPVGRIFLLHNGLNETDNLRFFYQLADWILKEDKGSKWPQRSACLIAPFPGHLMHFAHVGKFAQSPLSRYLSDSGDLFRQFMRYMVEMHWLLSVCNEKRPPGWMVGGSPIGGKLAVNIGRDWQKLRNASFDALKDEDKHRGKDESRDATEQRLVGKPLGVEEIEGSIQVLRSLLGMDIEKRASSVPVHVVGYSLGGFLAQSVFFAWPNMVTSCATICSGGAISALSPTAFAHSEEWQAVLHSLRAEIEGSMLARKIAHGPKGRVAGMAPGQFGYFHRIFNQVFLQEDPASYKQRLSEYGSRMLFVSGGEDPIVKTEKVLDASPDEGITMLSVARMTHFLGVKAQSDREEEQRRFWLPEAGGLIARAARQAEILKREERLRSQKVRRKPEPKSSERPKRRELASEEFERALDYVVAQVKRNDGWLYVCRNGLPGAFLPPDHHHSLGTALHHHDVAVQNYAAGLRQRADTLKAIRPQTTLVVSHKVEEKFIGKGELFEPHSDAPGKLSTLREREQAWKVFIDYWENRILWFRADLLAKGWKADTVQGQFARRVADWQQVPLKQMEVASIPDVWISLKNVVNVTFDPDNPSATATNFVRWVSEIVAEHQPMKTRKRRQPKSDKLKEYLEHGQVRIVKVSGADLNPRHRGRFEADLEPALLQLAHCAAALVRSTDIRPSNKQKG
jgi:hypothetical protein